MAVKSISGKIKLSAPIESQTKGIIKKMHPTAVRIIDISFNIIQHFSASKINHSLI